MESSTLDKGNDEPPVVNIFKNRHWRTITIIRLSIYILLRFTGLYYAWQVVCLAVKGVQLIQARATQLLKKEKSRAKMEGGPGLELLQLYFMVFGHAFVKRWPNDFTIHAWWYVYACLQDAESFRNHYMNTWSEKLANQSSTTHVFVDGNHFLALIPTSAEHITNADDAETLEFIRMWYCEYQSRRGLGGLLLPKKLTRIDKVQVSFAKSVWYSSNRLETLELGRTMNSHVTFFEDTWRVKGQAKITRELLEIDARHQGLEFIRTWNMAAVSAAVLLPFGLSLAFAAVWVGVYVANGTDVQVAVQTAFTVSSYIVTAGALLIALIAFLDSQSPKEM